MWCPVRIRFISATLQLCRNSKQWNSTTESEVQYKCERSGQNTQYFHFHLLLRKCVPCSISPNNSRWHNRRVRGILHSELYAPQPLTIPLFPFYFVSHLDHLFISSEIGGICWHKSRHNICKIPLQHSHTLTHLCLLLQPGSDFIHWSKLLLKVWEMESKTIAILWRKGKDVGKYSLKAVEMGCLKNGEKIVELSDCHLV